METKKSMYQKPATQVVKIKQQGHLLGGTEPQEPIPGEAREQRSNWGSED